MDDRYTVHMVRGMMCMDKDIVGNLNFTRYEEE